MSLRDAALRWLRVPHDPAPPAGDEEVRVFRAAPNYLRYLYVRWAVQHVVAAVGFWFALRFSSNFIGNIPDSIEIGGFATTGGARLRAILYFIESLAVLGFLAEVVGSLLLVKLDFEQRWYIVSNRSLRVREGLVRLHEKTMTFANVQNVSVRQGPLERLLGIANVEVRSAGGGKSEAEPGKENRDDMHAAYFRGVADAETIRSAIRQRLRIYRDSGLGDPDDVDTGGESLAQPARELAEEARALKVAFASLQRR